MQRAIIGYHQDDEDHWVAELACAHDQHVRHRPPFEERPWVATEEGRSSRLGTPLGCVRCDDREWPDSVVAYNETRVFDEGTVPDGLLREHRTKAGVWGRIEVLRGHLEYRVHAPFHDAVTLSPEVSGVVVPEVPHEVAPQGAVRFKVVFHRRPRGERVS